MGFLQLVELEVNMVQITGILEIKTGYVRVKPNVPFIGSLSGVSCYEINDGLVDIQLAPTPQDRIYLVDYSLSIDAAFLPTENWIVPGYDCDLDEVRGMITHRRNLQLQLSNNQLSLDNNRLVSEMECANLANIQLSLENNQLQLLNEQLQLEIENLKLENERLHKDKLLMEKHDIVESSLTLSSINILNRFL